MDNNRVNQRLLCGTISSFIATTIVHPFDILKISRQINIKPQYNFSSLYRGYSIGLFRQLTYSVPNVFMFTELNNLHKKHLKTEPTYKEKLAYGITSGAISGFTGNPSEVLLVRSIQPDKPKLSFLTHAQNVYRENGISGFFNGYKLAITRSAVYNGTRLPLYSQSKEKIQELYPTLKGTTTLHFSSAAISTITAIIVSNPIDVIKSRAQKEKPKSILQLARRSFKTEGFNLLHRGLFASICKSFPHSVISFVILEKTTQLFTGNDAI